MGCLCRCEEAVTSQWSSSLGGLGGGDWIGKTHSAALDFHNILEPFVRPWSSLKWRVGEEFWGGAERRNSKGGLERMVIRYHMAKSKPDHSGALASALMLERNLPECVRISVTSVLSSVYWLKIKMQYSLLENTTSVWLWLRHWP